MISDTPEPQPEPSEQYFPIEVLDKINGGNLEFNLEALFAEGQMFRRENAMFQVVKINSKKKQKTVVIKLCGLFGVMNQAPLGGEPETN